MFVVSDLALHQLVPSRFAIVREVKQMNEVRLLLLHRLPREVDDTL